MLLYLFERRRNKLNLSPEKQILLKLLKNSISDKNVEINFDSINFEKLFKLADKHSVNMLCFDSLKNYVDKMPESVYNEWVYFASRKMTLNENVLLVQKKLTEILEQNDINYFVFKGLAVANYYKNYQLRELGDIDFYIDYANFKRTHFLLKENGFKLVSTKSDKHFNYEYNGVEIEMHKGFWDMPENDCAKYLEESIKNSVEFTEKVTIDDYSFSGPNPVSNALILVLHIINHIQRGGIGAKSKRTFKCNEKRRRVNFSGIQIVQRRVTVSLW